jgi:hypothetical protein
MAFRLSRRAVLRGSAGVAIALPWFEAMAPERASLAAPAAPRRLLTVYQPGGTIIERWTPIGSEESFALGPILTPLAALKDRLIVLSGIEMKSATGGNWTYARGMVAWLTGTGQKGNFDTSYAQGPSVDQIIAGRISGSRPIASLNLAVRWGTGMCQGAVHPMDILSYGTAAAFPPIAPRVDPVAIWNELVGNDGTKLAWDRSILDAVDRRYVQLAARLGAADRTRLDQHLTSIRELEQRLSTLGGSANGACSAPALVDTSDYDPAAGRGAPFNGSDDPRTDAAIPKVGKLMMDMMVMAFACDLTAVGAMQWSDAECEYSLPWLGLDGSHKCYMNDCGFHAAECAQIATWYYEQHAYLLQRMAEVDMGGHSLLDETLVFLGSDIQSPSSYARTDMPFLLAGGGLRTGRWLKYERVSHNDLLVSLLRAFGGTEMTFGDPTYSHGPLPNLS